MKNIKKHILILILSVPIIFSCSDYLDTNSDPNEPRTTEADYLFGNATLSWSGTRTGGDLFLPIGFSNQSLASGGSGGWGYGADRYNLSPYSLINVWRYYYVNGGNNLQTAISISDKRGNKNASSQAKIILANSMYEATMIFGDIPYSEAWNPENLSPKFDKQEDVLNALLVLIDDAIKNFDVSSKNKIIVNDGYFKGDISKWIKYAKSLKLKILMTMVDKDPSKSSEIGKMITDGGMISSSQDNVLMNFYNKTGSKNPKFKLFEKYYSSKNTEIMANKNVFDFMDKLSDPRIPIFFEEGREAKPNEFIAVESATDGNKKTSVISLKNLWRADAPDVIFSLQEQLLFEAEIYARGIGVASNLTMAYEKLKAGVTASMKFYSVPDEKIKTFIDSSLPNISKMSTEEAVKEIHIQQWIDLMDRSLEAWVQSRRSGKEGNETPNLSLPKGAPAGGIIRRWDYPNDELISNPNAPSENPKIDTKMWFDL